MTKMFVVLEKCLWTEAVDVVGVFDVWTEANDWISKLIEKSEPETYGYMIKEASWDEYLEMKNLML